jgi:ABC-type enterochelin transport system substrate-binding protein
MLPPPNPALLYTSAIRKKKIIGADINVYYMQKCMAAIKVVIEHIAS